VCDCGCAPVAETPVREPRSAQLLCNCDDTPAALTAKTAMPHSRPYKIAGEPTSGTGVGRPETLRVRDVHSRVRAPPGEACYLFTFIILA